MEVGHRDKPFSEGGCGEGEKTTFSEETAEKEVQDSFQMRQRDFGKKRQTLSNETVESGGSADITD